MGRSPCSETAPRALALLLSAALGASLLACSSDFIATQFDVVITAPTTDAQYATSTDTVALSGTLEFTVGIHDDLKITWRNLTTGASGPGTVNASIETWSAGPVPLQDGSNQLRIDFEADGGWDDAALLTVVFTPGPLPVNGDAASDDARQPGTIVVPAGTDPSGVAPALEPRQVSGPARALSGAR